jgi:hypothetical protein
LLWGNGMLSNFTSKVKLVKLSTVLALLAFIAGCGGSVNTPSPPASHTSPTPINKQQGTAFLPNIGGLFDISGLLEVETGGISCSVDDISPFGNTLVLSTNRLTYDSGEIQRMSAYVDAMLNGQSSPLPDTMQIVLGGHYGVIKDWHVENRFGCTMQMDMTNIGKTSFQVSHMALRLTADSQQNNYQYRLINICSLPLPAQDLQVCPPSRGGGILPTIFEFKLKRGNADTLFQGQISRYSSSPLPPTLDQGQAARAVLYIQPSDTSSNLFYSIVPEITLDSAGEERTIQLTQLKSKIALVTPSQLSCYGLQNSTGTFSPLGTEPHANTWCL